MGLNDIVVFGKSDKTTNKGSSLGIMKRQETMPEKTTMNLFLRPGEVERKRKMRLAIVVVVVLVVVVVAVALFGGIAKTAALQAEVDGMKAQIAAYDEQLKNYDAVRHDYLKYTDGYLEGVDATLVDRVDIMRMVLRCCDGIGDLNSALIAGNTVSLTLTMYDLESVSSMRKNLEAEEMVWNVTVGSANKDSKTGLVATTMTVEISQDGKQPAATTEAK